MVPATTYRSPPPPTQPHLSNRTPLLRLSQVLRGVEKLITKACLTPRDETEQEWLKNMRTMLNMILGSTTEVQTALRELDELGSGGWRPASEALGLRTQWRPDDDGSLWVRIDGELSGASLLHASAVAHEAELWPKWMPFCGAAEVLTQISSYERTTYVQFDLTPMMKRGALIHWSISDSLQERQSILLLGASLGDAAPVEVPASAEGIKLASFKCIKVLIYPLTKTSCRVRWVSHVDLKAGSLPQTLVSMVTNKVAGSLLSTLMREAQKATQALADANAIYAGGAGSTPDVRRISSGAAPTADNVYLRRIQDDPSFYGPMTAIIDNYFEMFGEGGGSDDSAATRQ